MAENSKEPEFKTRVTATKSENVKCIGNICYNPDSGKIEVELARGSCPASVIKSVVENIVKGAEVEFVLPKEEKKAK